MTGIVRRISNKIMRMRMKPRLQGGENVILHVGQHKAMTSYFNNILLNLCIDFDWAFYKFYNEEEFVNAIGDLLPSNKLTVICCSNFYPDLSLIREPLKGTNIVRDPRDLLVSGYNYHKWTEEPWANIPLPEELWERLHLQGRFPGLGESDWKGMSYRELLNTVEEVDGYALELDLRQKHFDAMKQWDFENPDFLELKYETLFNRETEQFDRIFRHYGFHEGMRRHAMTYVKKFSFQNLKKKGAAGKKKHASVGKTSQWKERLPKETLAVFTERYGDLLQQLGYDNSPDGSSA